MIRLFLTYILLILGFNSCKKDVSAFVFHPGIESRVSECLSSTNRVPDAISIDTGNFTFAVFSDIHITEDNLHFLDHIRDDVEKYDIDFCIVAGDLTENGLTYEFSTSQRDLWQIGVPYYVTIGNHDRIIMRKAQTSSIPRKWVRDFKDVLEVPNWNFVDSVIYDNVQYIHGEGGTARTKCRADMMSTVQGHLHTQCYTEWYVGQNFKVFGTQVGCGIDHDSYAMAYAKRGKKPAVGCAVVIGGKTVINKLMEL